MFRNSALTPDAPVAPPCRTRWRETLQTALGAAMTEDDLLVELQVGGLLWRASEAASWRFVVGVGEAASRRFVLAYGGFEKLPLCGLYGGWGSCNSMRQ